MASNRIEEVFNRLKTDEVLPNYAQECLLQACLTRGDVAIEKWKEWQSLVDIDLIDHHSNRLLPLLYHNLSSMGIEDKILGRYKGVSRKNWYKNQLLLNDLKALVSIFNKEGIDTIVLKGAALALQFYSSFGLRPMADLDVLVKREDVPKVLNLLHNSGWKSIVGISYEEREHSFFTRLPIQECYLDIRASCGLRNQTSREFDLHTFALADSMNQALNTEMWNLSTEIDLGGGIQTKTLCPTDMLLHIIVHGLRPSKAANLRWISDAYQICAEAQIDWNRLIKLASENGVLERLAVGLFYLNNLLRLSIPDTVMNQLQQVAESFETSRVRKDDEHRVVNFTYLWQRTKALNQEKSFPILLFKLLETVRCNYLLKHSWQVPFYLVYKAFRSK